MSSQPPAPEFTSGAYADKLIIDTPEQTSLEFAIAGIGSRFLALALDTVILVAAGTILGLGLVLVAVWLPGGKFGLTEQWIVAIVILLAFSFYYGYFVIFEAAWNGQTPGKRAARIRVIKESGRPINPAESVARNLMRIVDQLPFFYGIGIASALISKQNKRLGDFVAGTIVIHERTLQDVKPLWEAAKTAGTVKFGSERLSPEDFALIESFLNRRDALAPDVRFRMAEQIVARIKPRLSIPPAEMPSSEKLLEAVASERRANAGYI
jgi:uncharacterized RDD family membrane protein YckC